MPDGKRHVFLFIIVTFLIIRTGVDYYTDSDEKKQLKAKFLSESTLLYSQLADRALWEGTKECGDRSIYEDLNEKLIQAQNIESNEIIAKQIERIKSDYKTSILVPRVDALPAVCKRGTMKGDTCIVEPIEGFSATNVVEQLDRGKYPRCTTRARAANILRNIETATDKEGIKEELFKNLISILENDPSLLVSKLALDRYSQFTSFVPSDIFDFKGAIDNWRERGKEQK